LRIFDEFKDYEHDLIHYSHRPVPRGLISKRELVSLLSIIISIELIIVVISGINSLLPFVISFAYSLLMFKEFFVKDWLKRNFTAYIISHEILSIPLFFYICTISGFNIYSFKAPFIWYLIVFVSITLFILEITRKFRAKEHEIPSKDTYTAQYGIMPTSFLLIVLSAFSVLIAFNILSSLYVPVSILFILPLLSLIIFIFSIYDFNMDTIPKKAKNVFIYSILFTFSFWAVMIVSFLSI
jgi:4-hydroxybenzoate polyprenyltransferase